MPSGFDQDAAECSGVRMINSLCFKRQVFIYTFYPPKYSAKLFSVSQSLMLCSIAPNEETGSDNTSHIPIARFSVDANLPAIKSTSRLMFLWSSFSITCWSIKALRSFRLTKNPVSGFISPFTVT